MLQGVNPEKFYKVGRLTELQTHTHLSTYTHTQTQHTDKPMIISLLTKKEVDWPKGPYINDVSTEGWRGLQ